MCGEHRTTLAGDKDFVLFSYEWFITSDMQKKAFPFSNDTFKHLCDLFGTLVTNILKI